MVDGAIDDVRRFNRTVAERIGALEDHFLGRSRPLGEARLLWEIGPNGADVRELRSRLGLDSGYLSRLLRSLESQRLVSVRTHATDGRVRRAVLTKRGLAERTELDRRSDDVAQQMLEPLNDKQRAAFLSAVADVERLLRASMVRFDVEDAQSDDAQWCLSQYYAELTVRFDAGFDPSLSSVPDAGEFTRPRGAFLIARLRGSPIGCGAVKVHEDGAADIKRMWIAASARGLGLGRRLLSELERHARDQGATLVRLETNRALKEAIAMYRAHGYTEVAPFNDELYAHHWFERRL
jgi:DNA-binding MarR family transcriptional regulator/GNAT superfamily N-acetyltransferase